MSTTRKLTTSAMMVALATVLMLVSKMIPSPWLQGGSVTIASMVPIIIISLMFDIKWGLLSATVFSLIQMTEFYPPPTQTFVNFTLVVLLDYILAYGVIGLAGAFYKMFGKKAWAIPVSGAIVTTLRFVCHIVSGIIIWGVYRDAGQGLIAYSVGYNGSYMIPEIIITTVVLAIMAPMFKNKINRE